MQPFVRHVCLERSRLALIGVLSFAAGFLLYSHFDATRMGLSIPVITGLIYMVAVVLAAAFTSYFLPGLRRLTDSVAFTRFGFAFWVAGTQNYEMASDPFVSATIVVCSAVLVLNIGTAISTQTQRLPVASRLKAQFGAARRAYG